MEHQQQHQGVKQYSPVSSVSTTVDSLTRMDIEDNSPTNQHIDNNNKLNQNNNNNNINNNNNNINNNNYNHGNNGDQYRFNIPSSSINSIGNLVHPVRSVSSDSLLTNFKSNLLPPMSYYNNTNNNNNNKSSNYNNNNANNINYGSPPSTNNSSSTTTPNTLPPSTMANIHANSIGQYIGNLALSPPNTTTTTTTTTNISFNSAGQSSHLTSPSTSATTSSGGTGQTQPLEYNNYYLSPPDNPKDRLKEFKQVRIIGTGTFGRVYLVQNIKDHNFYAMKCLNKSDVVKLKQVEHLISEKSILSSIHHPFIVNLYQAFQDEKKIYLLFEYVAGGEVFTHLRRASRFSNSMAKFYAAEIVLALEYLHKHNIVYRDLKPENLLLDNQGHIKITDFGFAKRVEDRTFTLCGTPEYLAPEIIQSKGHGKAVDWWALGILIFEMLAGYPPFFDDDPFAIYDKILAGRITFPQYFDLEAKDLVKRLLTSDRTRRLGALRDGALDVKNHRWFSDINWGKLYDRSVVAPFIPNIQHQGDSSNFEQYEEEPMCDDPVPPNYVDPYEQLFTDF